MAAGTGHALDGVAFHEVDQSRWPDFVRLFESRGGPKNCWCMVWRGTSKERTDAASRRAGMERRIASEIPVGLLGYVDGEPIAWCSVAPRSTYRRLGGPEHPGEEPDSVWSVVCFFVTRRFRNRGMMTRLLGAAIEHARDRGATVLEAYPVDPDSPSYRFMGFAQSFQDAGFEEVGRAGTRRHVMRRRLV